MVVRESSSLHKYMGDLGKDGIGKRRTEEGEVIKKKKKKKME
jgi:hypothetical protein